MPTDCVLAKLRQAVRSALAQAGPKEVASAAHSAETSSTTDCVRQARPKAVLRASDPTQPPVLQRFATASSQQNPPAHSSGRISSTEEVTVGLQHAPVGSTNLKWNTKTQDLTVTIVMSGLAPDSTHPAHIHLGNCNSNGPVKYMLNDVKAGNVGNGSSTTTIHNVASSIPATSWCINIHNGPGLNTPDQFTPIACATIKNDDTSVQHNQTVWVRLGPTNAANQSAHGNAELTLNHNTLTVVVTLDGLVPGSAHAAHIHAGSCQSQGGIVYMLNNVVADAHGHAQVTTVIQDVQRIPGRGWYVNVHYSTDISTQTGFDPIACGNVV